MADDLRDGDDGTEVFVFLEVGQLLGQDDDVGELDYLRGLDAYAEEAPPCSSRSSSSAPRATRATTAGCASPA